MIQTVVFKEWSDLFQKSLVLKKADLNIIVNDIVLAVSWDYADAKHSLTVNDIEDYLADAFKRLKSVYNVNEVVIVSDDKLYTISEPDSFSVVIDECFGLENIIGRVKEEWERGNLVVPWWYQEKLKFFNDYLGFVILSLMDICLTVEEIDTVYVRRCRGRLKLYVYVVVITSEEVFEQYKDDWEESDEGVEILSKLEEAERRMKRKFPLVEFVWKSCHKNELSDMDWFKLPGLELVLKK